MTPTRKLNVFKKKIIVENETEYSKKKFACSSIINGRMIVVVAGESA